MLQVHQLVEDFNFEVIAGMSGLEKEITDCSLKRPSAELMGFLAYLTPERIQVYGRTELGLIQGIPLPELKKRLEAVLIPIVPCAILTRGLPVPPELIEIANAGNVPLLTTPRSTTQIFYLLIRYLINQLAPSTYIHGVLVDIYGVGVLITGESGIGKSETALEMIKAGHLLIADDAVVVRRVDEENLLGTAPELTRHLIEVRGLGILDVTKFFGEGAIRDEKTIQLIVHLEEWRDEKIYDRLGIDPYPTREILGIAVPEITIPVRPGRNLANIIEVAVIQMRLRTRKNKRQPIHII